MGSEDAANFIFEGTKDRAGDEEGNPKRIGWKTQIIDGDAGPEIALSLENLENIAESAPGHCNPDFAGKLLSVFKRFPFQFRCGIDANSSRGGRLIRTLTEDVKRQSMEYHEKGAGKKVAEKGMSLFGQDNQ